MRCQRSNVKAVPAREAGNYKEHRIAETESHEDEVEFSGARDEHVGHKRQ